VTERMIRKPEDLLNGRNKWNLMAKGSDGPARSVGAFLFGEQRKEHTMKKVAKKQLKDVIARRKCCKAEGTGLSHYILMDKKSK
jgi:modified peptide precursor CbpA